VTEPRKARAPAPVVGNRLVAHLQQRAEEERARISRMLHHDVSGMLAAARMDLSRLMTRVAAEGDLPEQLRRVDQLLERVIGDARAEMQRLHPALIDHFGLPVALRHLIEERCRRPGCRFTVELVDESEGLVAPLPMATYRTVEALLADDGLQDFTANFGPRRDGYLLELALSPFPANPDPARVDDLRALRAWVEELGATWKESRRDKQWLIELRLPRRPAASLDAALAPGG
jgi:hypothetical protein